MEEEDALIKEISDSNLKIQEQLRNIKEETLHDNITMIVDYFAANLMRMREALLKKECMHNLKKGQDIKMYNHKRLEEPDPESIQSVLLFISSTMGREHEIVLGAIRKFNKEREYLEDYASCVETLRIKSENLFHDLVER